jgi:cell wall-associated NlpC family hydrolase
VGTRPFASTTLRLSSTPLRRCAAAIAAGTLAVGMIISAAGTAGAAPQPTVAQVQAKLKKLNLRAAVLDQRYNQAQQELTSASQRLKLVNTEESRYLARFRAMRTQVARIAALAYENGNMTSVAAMLTSGNAQQILDQSSILLELSSANSAEMSQFIAAADQLNGAQQAARRAKTAIATLRNSLASQKKSLKKLIGQQQTLLAQLTPAQQQTTGPGGAGGGGAPPAYKGATGTQAEQAVAFAYAQLGKPYVFGAAGPNSYDCSGLTMASWAAAGVSIPRVSYAQMSGLPSVPLNNLQPGDILGFAGNSHVGIYVGGNFLIDAPIPGQVVEKVALSGWYQQNLDGAVRP